MGGPPLGSTSSLGGVRGGRPPLGSTSSLGGVRGGRPPLGKWIPDEACPALVGSGAIPAGRDGAAEVGARQCSGLRRAGAARRRRGSFRRPAARIEGGRDRRRTDADGLRRDAALRRRL